MKQLLIITTVFLLISMNAQSQRITLTARQKVKLQEVAIPVLKKCIASFDGKYLPGTTVKRVEKNAEGHYGIIGTVSYVGEQCGEVRDRDYKIFFYKEGSETYGETCIYSPYCFLGVVTSEEWDCACRKWQYGSDETIDNAIQILQLIKEIAESESN